MSNLRFAPIAVAALFNPLSAAATVLTEENESDLCTASYDGQRAVDRDALAYAVATEAGAGRYLDGANATGARDETIRLRSSTSSLGEPAYAIWNMDEKPFGPNVDLSKDKRAAKAREGILAVFAKEMNFLTDDGSYVVGEKLTLKVVRKPGYGASMNEADWANARFAFALDPPMVILCVGTPGGISAQAPGEKGKDSGDGSSLVNVLRLRGTVKDLTVAIKPTDKNHEGLKSAKPASITFQRDERANTSTFGLVAVVGYRFGDESGAFDAIPFISYENKTVAGGKAGHKNDIEKFSPGLLFGHKYEGSSFAVHSKLEGTYIHDYVGDSRQAKLRAYIEPAFALGDGQGVLFGSYLAAIGPLQWRPELAVILDASNVLDRGTNAALASADSFFGAGAELGLRAYLDCGKPISDVTLQVGVRHLELFGDIDREHARRWYGSLEYAPEDFPYLGISLAFSKGQNDDTFQDEETYGLTITARY